MSSLAQPLEAPTPFVSFLKPVDELVGLRFGQGKDSPRTAKEEARQKGYDEGFAAGTQEGLAQGREQGHAEGYREASEKEAHLLVQFREELEAFSNDLKVESNAWFDEAEESLTGLITDLAKKVLASELKLGRESIKAIVHEAVAATGLKGSIRLRLNPVDRPLIEEHQDALRTQFAQITGIELTDDSSIASGCIIETSAGVVNATSDQKLAEFEAHLEDEAA